MQNKSVVEIAKVILNITILTPMPLDVCNVHKT